MVERVFTKQTWNVSAGITQHRYNDDDDLRRDPRRKNHTENDQTRKRQTRERLDAGKDDPQLREHAPISVHSDLGVRPSGYKKLGHEHKHLCEHHIQIEACKRTKARKVSLPSF